VLLAAAVLLAGESSRAMLASARVSCYPCSAYLSRVFIDGNLYVEAFSRLMFNKFEFEFEKYEYKTNS